MEWTVSQCWSCDVAEIGVDFLVLVCGIAILINLKELLHLPPVLVVMVDFFGFFVSELSKIDPITWRAVEWWLKKLDMLFISSTSEEHSLAISVEQLALLAIFKNADLLAVQVVDSVKLAGCCDDLAGLIVTNINLANVQLGAVWDWLAGSDFTDDAVDKGGWLWLSHCDRQIP